ncbi:MAG: transposase [Alphaproteobacteria bacterium]
MPRLPRLVLPGVPCHVTQRGNRRARTFFEDGDYALYRDLVAQAAAKAGAEVWCYCLMPNHVHIIVTPSDADGLRRTFADAHRRYTGYINARNRWTGHLWQGRFGAVAMDEAHLAAAVRYVSLNPVRARLVSRAEDWPWSSVRAHLAERDDALVRVGPVLERYGSFAGFLGQDRDDAAAWRGLRMSETSGRPLGSDAWLDALEAKTGRTLKPQKRGPKPKGVFSKLAP